MSSQEPRPKRREMPYWTLVSLLLCTGFGALGVGEITGNWGGATWVGIAIWSGLLFIWQCAGE
jgi:hypothetical protein